jgi:hypothetical protein
MVATEKKRKEPIDDENIVNCLPKEIVLNILADHVCCPSFVRLHSQPRRVIVDRQLPLLADNFIAVRLTSSSRSQRIIKSVHLSFGTARIKSPLIHN